MISVTQLAYPTKPTTKLHVVSVGVTHPAYTGSILLGLLDIEPVPDQLGKDFEFTLEGITQGVSAYGKMRDRDVYHHHVDGSVQIISSAPYAKSGDARLVVDGWYVDSGNPAKLTFDSVGSLPGASVTKNMTVKPNPISTGYSLENYYFEGTPTLTMSINSNIMSYETYVPAFRIESTKGVLLSEYPENRSTTYYRCEYRGGRLYISSPSKTLSEAMLLAPKTAVAALTRLATTSLPPKSQVEIKDAISRSTSSSLLQDLDSNFDYGTLSVDIAKSQKYVANNILLLIQDVLNLRKLATNLADLFDLTALLEAVRDMKSGPSSVKAARTIARKISDSILLPKYAIAPNIGDLNRLGAGVWKYVNEEMLSESRLHSRNSVTIPCGKSQIDVSCVLTAIVSNNASRELPISMQCISAAKKWGMYPEMQNLWDIIPFSFVVDWFVQYGDFFEAIDNYLYLENYFPVEYSISSAKATRSYDVSEILPNSFGFLTKTEYERHVDLGTLPLPRIHLTADSSINKHWVESGALVVQRL